jgi:hypothetical protein
MVISNLNLVGIRSSPHEPNPVLVVDPDALLPIAVALERFQLMAGNGGKIAQRYRGVEMVQFPLRNPRNRLEFAAEPALENVFSLLVAEAFYHGPHPTILRRV